MKFIKKEYEERYFIGVELEGGIDFESQPQINELWHEFMNNDLKLLGNVDMMNQFIGLECYPPDMMETKKFDYYAMVQVEKLIKHPGFVTKKLPKGTYINFQVEFDRLHDEIQQVYAYIKEQKINVHMGFDVELYTPGVDYSKPGATLFFSFMLNHE